MNEDEKALAEQVRTARKARRGYTQQMLADDAGVSLGTASLPSGLTGYVTSLSKPLTKPLTSVYGL